MEDSGRRGKMGAVTEEDSDSLFGSDDEDEGKKQPAASSASAAANDTRGHQASQDARPGHRSGAPITVAIPWMLLPLPPALSRFWCQAARAYRACRRRLTSDFCRSHVVSLRTARR